MSLVSKSIIHNKSITRGLVSPIVFCIYIFLCFFIRDVSRSRWENFLRVSYLLYLYNEVT